MSRPLISLVSMVRNEENILERMIASVKDIVDEFVIVDTGSTDRTKEIIAKYGPVHETPFVNFVDTKNKCLELATGEYILFMDADEVLYRGASVLREWAEERKVEALICKITEGPPDYTIAKMQYDRIRMFRNHGRWKFEGPNVHEVLTGPGPFVTDGRVAVRHDHSGKGEASPEKYEMWKGLLLDYLDKHPGDSRALFYLGRTCRDLGRLLEAASYYMRYLDIEGNLFVDERWQASYDMACIYRELGEFEQCLAYCALAEEIDPRRAEHMNLRGWVYFARQDYGSAIEAYKVADARPIPNNISLFLDPTEYGLIPKDQLILSLYHAKRYGEAEVLCSEVASQQNAGDCSHTARILNNLWWCRTKTNMTIFMCLGDTPEPIYRGIIEKEGVGGVETTYIELSEELARLGHNVFLFCKTEESHSIGTLMYVPFEEYPGYRRLNPDVVVTSRWFDSLQGVPSAKKILWLQDANPLEGSYDFDQVDLVVVSSQWHSDYLQSIVQGRLRRDKLTVIPLGIRKDLFLREMPRDPLKVLYSSNPNRGLEILAGMWPEIDARAPGAKLTVLYGWEGLLTWNNSDEWVAQVEEDRRRIMSKLASYNVEFTGRVSKKQVAEEMLSATVLAYPCNFYETFCITALEAQISGLPVVTSNMGALRTTLRSTGNVKLEGSPLSERYQKRFVEEVVRLLRDQAQWELCSTYLRTKSLQSPCDWKDIARDWQQTLWTI